MPLITLRQALDAARQGGYGIGAFNVTDLVQVEAVLEAASEKSAPVIVQTIVGASAFRSDELFWEAMLGAVARYPEVPAVVHLDHGPDERSCERALAAGFSSVMIDGSVDHETKLPRSFEANIEITASVVAKARKLGVSVEGELGTIGGAESDGTPTTEIILADPAEAEEFVARTGVDALAVAIGTSHGAYKFTSPPDGSVLHMNLIEEIASRVPGTHLVMHGSSSLPADIREEINRVGGELPESWGVPEDEKARSTKLGVTKINQGMDSHMAYMAGLRGHLAQDRLTVDPAPAQKRGADRMRAIIAERMDVFGQAGHAEDHEWVPFGAAGM
ncbi:ketose-bisphosphate aldolase [uncultured Demequina sp.]|uniref:ketose-bisphosphate aldolase n=1 Tax=uncultured Demequina sp. TaxID=693499 RepID=UPI0025F655CA|nr:ketose-bisphosphate aldolase [uncultured Demequina sp.]